MAKIINLKQVRKAEARSERDAEADANRRRFGRTRAEKLADKNAATRADKLHDSRLLQPPDTKPEKD